MKTYTGARTFDGVVVNVDDVPLSPRGDLKTYSLDGYEWGYEGPDPTQLALAILADATDDESALALAPAFMTEIVANFDNEWEMSEEQVRAARQALQSIK